MNDVVRNILSDMVSVEGGSFDMGEPSGDFAEESRPVHRVFLDSYYIHKCVVTRELWASIMNPEDATDETSPEQHMPAAMVSWFDAIKFCNELSRRLGLDPCYELNGKEVGYHPDRGGMRLPTEAEWEYAARGGAKREITIYSGSDAIDEVAWYRGNSGGVIHGVAEKHANGLGLYDMSGNIWEWCWDWYGRYTSDPESNPHGPLSGIRKVYRGGSYLDFEYGCTVSIRGHRALQLGYVDVGFRIARNQS